MRHQSNTTTSNNNHHETTTSVSTSTTNSTITSICPLPVQTTVHSQESQSIPTHIHTQETQTWVLPPHAHRLCPQYHDRHEDQSIREVHPPQQLTTILFQNLNGICKYGTTIHDSIIDTHQMMNSHNISVMCISEHHLASAQPEVKLIINNTVNNIQPRGNLRSQFDSSATIPSQNHRLMGGTAILNQGPITGRLKSNGSGGDPLGRWSYTQYDRQGTTPLIIVSIYQVCQQPTNTVGQTAWHQQRLHLDDNNRHKEHPRQAFYNDLEAFLTPFHQHQYAIIIGGDWNDTLYNPRSTLLRISTKFQLSDPWLVCAPESEEFATYQRGKTRIDSVLISHSLIQYIHSIAYTPVGHLVNSDHRGLLLTMFTKPMFQTTLSAPEQRLPRAVRSKDRKSVTTFVETAHNYLQTRRAFELALDIQTAVSSPATASDVEKLDTLLGHATNFAEKKCRRRRRTWYSIPLVRTRLEVSYLKHFRNGLQITQDRTDSTLTKLEYIQSDINNLPTSLDEVNKMIATKLKDLCRLRLTSQNHRHTDIQQQLMHNSQHLNKKDPRQKIKKAEVAARTWATLDAITRTSGKSQRIDRIDIPSDWPAPFTEFPTAFPQLSDPKEAKEWISITNPKEMEYYLLLRNKLHFGQAQGTPFTAPPLSDQLDWGGTSPSSQALLNGTYIPPTTFPDICQRVLQHCKRQTDPLIQAELTPAEFIGKMKCWRETTTTSPSGRHLGRYKTLYAKSIYAPESIENEAFLDKQQDLLYVVLTLVNYCIRTGYVLKRWRRITNMMILKDPDNFRIHRLRIIHIYEADLNLLMAVKWRQLLHKADKLHLINVNQYGGRPGCEAQTLAFMEEIKIDISYLTRRLLLTFDNDAASCYDRILPVLIAILNQKYGLPLELARVHGTMLLMAEYRLLTANGTSVTHYSHSSSFPIYGSGQGSGNSPVLWLLISATLFDIHHELATGAMFCTPDGSISTKISISGFVDDTNTSLNNWQPQHQPPVSALLPQLQLDAQCWNDLLYTSGGKLELTKCSFHSLEFEFNADGTPRVRIKQPPSILLQDSVTQAMIEIPSLSVLHPHKTLGHWKAPSGRSTTQLKQLQQKAKKISILLATSPIARYGAKIAYLAKYVAALGYVLPQCHFPHRELRKAEKASIATLISKCGFSSRSPHAVLFTPVYMGGSGFIHWHTIQATGQILLFVKHWRSTSQTSELLRIQVAWAQWQSGRSQSILRDSAMAVPYLEARWLTSLREALTIAKASLRLDNPMIPQAERFHDEYIMDIAHNSQAFTPKELHILNCCRLYLHVTTASEMYNVEGTSILSHFRLGNRPPWFDPNITIVIQQRPSEYQWKTVWNKLIQIIRARRIPFGRFILKRCAPRLRREMYQDSGQTYLWYAGRYHKCAKTQDASKFLLEPDESVTAWSPNARSVPIDKLAKVCSTIYAGKRSIPRAPAQIHTTQFCTKSQQKIAWTLPPPQCHTLITACKAEIPLILVSDGSSIHGKHMSFGVVIGFSTGQILMEISGPAPGIPSSHRAECYACLAGLWALQQLHSLVLPDATGPFIPFLHLYSDNKAMINSIQQRRTYTNQYTNRSIKSDWDLLEQINQCLTDLCTREPKATWVKGHQDRYVDNIDKLPAESKFNIRADALANEYLASHPTFSQFQSAILSTTRCQLDVNGVTVNSNFKQHIHRSISEQHYQDYLRRRHKWEAPTIQDVDWRALESAANTYFATEVHLSKLIHGLLPTRAHVARFQPWIPSSCHFCTAEETIHHLQTCACHPAAIRFRTSVYDRVSKYCIDKHLPQKFQDQFLDMLSTTLDTSDPSGGDSENAVIRQQRIGKALFTRGFLSIAWRQLLDHSIQEIEAQHAHASSTGNPYLKARLPSLPKNTSQTHLLIAGLIKLMWGAVGDLWLDHLALVHRTTELPVSPETHANLQRHVSLLQGLKDHSCPCDRDQYFLKDTRHFCTTATTEALHRYIAEYKPRILTSVRTHLSLREFTRQQITEIISNATTWSPEQVDLPLPPTFHITGEPSHRKHQRYRHRYPSTAKT